MKKVFFIMILGVMFSLLFIVPSSALSMQDVETDPNYEVYVDTMTVSMDIILDYTYDCYDFELPYDDLSVLKYEFEITNYEGMIDIWFIELYDFGGENYGSYRSGDEIVVPRTSCFVRMELYSDVALDNVVIEYRIYRYRLSAEFSSASTAYREGYDKGRADEAEIAKGQIDDAYIQGGIDRSNDIAAHLSREISEYVYVVPDIKPGFNSWVSFSSEFLAAMADHYETVEIPKSFQSGYDKGYKDGGDGAALEGEPAGSYYLGYYRGYLIGKTEAYDGKEIVDSIDRFADHSSRTLLQILNTEILGYSLLKFFVAILLILIGLILVPFIMSVV